MSVVLQWAETQIDAAHEPEHMPGALHGHTWFIRAAKKIDPDHFIPSVEPWLLSLLRVTAAFDHRLLGAGEALAEQIAAKVGQVIGADEVEVWRFIRGGRVGATWRA